MWNRHHGHEITVVEKISREKKKVTRCIYIPPRPVLYAPSPCVPSTPVLVTSPSTYFVASGLMLPAPPLPCDMDGSGDGFCGV